MNVPLEDHNKFWLHKKVGKIPCTRQFSAGTSSFKSCIIFQSNLQAQFRNLWLLMGGCVYLYMGMQMFKGRVTFDLSYTQYSLGV